MVAASAALTLSGVPFMGPIGGARVGYINGEFVLNPQIDEMVESKLDLVVAGTGDAVLMVESEAKELSEDVMLGAVMFGHKGFQPVIDAIIELAEKAAKEPRAIDTPDNSALYAQRQRDRRGGSARRLCAHRQDRAPRRHRRGQGEGRRHAGAGRCRRRAVADSCSPTCSRSSRRRSSAATSSTRARASTAATSRPCARSSPRSASCRAPTARRCSPAARPRRWWWPRSAPARTSSSSTPCRERTKRRSCCTTTSRPIRSARPAAWARPAAARSATASSPGARSGRSCRPRTSSPTRSASSPRSPNRTAPRRWRRSAAPRCR